MGSRIVLINANRCVEPDPVFPLGLAYLNAALRQAGHECVWLDPLADTEPLAGLVQRACPDFAALSLRNLDDVVISKRRTFFDALPSLVRDIRAHSQCPVILGGSAFSLFPERLLELAQADFGVVGEGESSLLALVAAVSQARDYTAIPGLVFRAQARIVVNPPQPEPFCWPLTEADRPVRLAEHYQRTGSMLNVQTQRGCAHRCCYCTYPLIEGRQHRRWPAGMIADEFEQIKRLGARYVFVVDSVFNSSPQHVAEVCETLIRRELKLPWGCFLRPQGLTRHLMRLMARAGLKHIEFGSDSLCDEVLAAYHKDLTFADILHSSELAREAEVEFCHFLIAGGPGETLRTLDEGYANSTRLQGAVIMAVVGMRVYPGTPLFDRALAEGQVQPGADLLKPAYYLAPGITQDLAFAKLREFATRSPNWIPGDPTPAYERLVARLRQRGVAGPLWSYFSTIQRLWPQGFAGQ